MLISSNSHRENLKRLPRTPSTKKRLQALKRLPLPRSCNLGAAKDSPNKFLSKRDDNISYIGVLSNCDIYVGYIMRYISYIELDKLKYFTNLKCWAS
jgi:hypothetical protein